MRSTGLSGIHCRADSSVPLFDRIAISDLTAGEVAHGGDDPKVTVIIPAYNSEATIGTALDSVLAQTWRNLEVIVVDDLSTDGTAAVVRERQLRDSRVRILTAPVNRGPYVARNLALELATGEFVTCNDADDWSHPQRIAIQLREMLRRQNLVATVAGWARCTNDLLFSRRGNPGHYGQLNISSLMFRREPVVHALGCWDSVRFGADTEFFNRLKAAFGQNAVLEMPLAILSLGRLTSGSLTGDSAFGYPGFPMGARRAYRDAYSAHHGRSPATPYRGLAVRRPFPVPAPMSLIKERTGGSRNFDVVIAADLRNPESTGLIQADIPALTGLGYRVALVNMPAYDFEPVNAPPNDQILSLVDGDRVQMVVYGEQVACRAAVVVDPGILRDRQDYLPKIESAEIHVVLPSRADLAVLSAVCAENIERYFGRPGAWHCANADQARSLSEGALGRELTIDKRPWKGLRRVLDLAPSGQHPQRWQNGAPQQSGGVKLIDIKDIAVFSHSDPNGVAVIMPCIDVEKGRASAEILLRRAQMPCLVLVVVDSIRQGFIKTLNAAAAQMTVRYVVYLAEDAFPARGWLHRAYQALEESGKGLLGFNDGKWDGRIASFGMVRTSWVRRLYGGDVLNAEYRAHKADNELTVIARVADEYEYRPDCTLVEVDPRKDVRGSNQADDEIFAKRMQEGFGGIITRSEARALAKPYKVKWPEKASTVTDHPIVSRAESGAAKPAVG